MGAVRPAFARFAADCVIALTCSLDVDDHIDRGHTASAARPVHVTSEQTLADLPVAIIVPRTAALRVNGQSAS